MIKCSQCGKEHFESRENCCWITCECGARICGGCGSTDIGSMEMDPEDNEAEYWCCRQCESCGLEGCGMCI